MSSSKKALIVGAHPDDCEYAAGGCVALLVEQGWEVHFLIVTDGSKGSPDINLDAKAFALQRQQEQRNAAKVLGIKSVEFMQEVDGEVQADRAFLEKMVGAIRRIRPWAVYTHFPNSLEYWAPESSPRGKPRMSHRDHRVVGQTVMDAIYPAARDCRNFPHQVRAGLATYKVRELYLWGHPNPNHSVDITSVWTKKVDSLQAHVSQMPQDANLSERWFDKWQESGIAREYFYQVSID